MGWKYIMLEDKLTYVPIIFPDRLVHVEMFTVTKLLAGSKSEFGIRSAGVLKELNVIHAYGESTTLGIKSHRDDTGIINRYPYFHGVKP